MCGICGVAFNDPTRAPDRAQVDTMRDRIAHRGPDDAGTFVAPGIALGSRRLAVLDLSPRGHMPMSSPDGRYHIAYNGEVYNYRTLRREMESRGHRFRTDTDTEVVLALYIEEGERSLQRFNGMFAFTIWDEGERTLFLARDRLGVKPLYYAQRPEGLYFASEEKALFAAGVPASFNHETWDELLCFRYVAGEDTPFVGVQRLLPGYCLTWRSGHFSIRRWWSLAERVREQRDELMTRGMDDAAEWFGATFDDAIALRRISDVPLGVLLSGGLDSGSVAASLALQAGSGVATFTVRFPEPTHDEGPAARLVAEKWNLDAHELYVDSNDLLPLLERASWLNDEPLAHGNDLYLLAISEYAKPKVTVLLSGEGADETLGGYVRYRPLAFPSLLAAGCAVAPVLGLPLRLSHRGRKLHRFLSLGRTDDIVLHNACDLLPSELTFLARPPRTTFAFRETMLREAMGLFPNEPLRQAMYSDQHTFLCSILDRNDRMTMGASIECRVPFLDFRLVEALAALPSRALISGRQSKALLRRSVARRLPESVQSRPKWGFGVPWSRYFRAQPDFQAVLRDLPDSPLVREGPFDRRRLGRAIEGFLAGDDRHEPLVRQMVMISVWHRVYFDRLRAQAPPIR